MSYPELHAHFRRLGHLQHVAAILQWDEAVMLAPAGGGARADALSSLEVLMHGQLLDPHLPQWLAEAESDAGALSPEQAANLVEMGRLVRRARAVPAALVQRSAHAQLTCEQAWRRQRPENDFAGFSPLLAEVVAIKRDVAACLGEALGLSPYDALLDEYDPGTRAVDIDAIFEPLRQWLPPLIAQVIAHQGGEQVIRPEGVFPIEAQRALGAELMAAVGFDAERGRLDVSHHPFCGGVPSDVRITTRYDTADFTKALMGVLHETGHAKYEQGLPADWVGQPAGAARGMAIHEGQSLLQEMQISRSRPFMTFLAPRLRAAFPDAVARRPGAFEPDNLYRLFTRVRRSKIRVDADEVTYPCHILLRYDIERALIGGEMEVSDIPERWDSGMHALLGIHTGDDYRDGCMQDVHWAGGGFGYFPSYTLGAMTAAQLFAAAVRAHPSIPEDLARGDLGALDAFLAANVWSRASFLDRDGLMRYATGESLNPKYFEAHLRNRYLAPAG